MTAIIDYGVGNLFSLSSSFAAIGEKAVVTSDEAVIRSADRLVLPGVGAFGDAAEKLRQSGMDRLIYGETGAGKPLLGICLGMQLLFEKSCEYGEHKGLGILKGEILPFDKVLPSEYKIPHIGWNAITGTEGCPLFKYISSGAHVYFVHSFYAPIEVESRAAATEYGIDFCSAVQQGKVFGCQFHPEKSGAVGLNILRGFTQIGA